MITEINQNEIMTKLAYKLWEKAGKPSNQDMQFWLEAQAKCQYVHQSLIQLYHLIAECEWRGLEFPSPTVYGAKDAAWLTLSRMIDLEIEI